MLRVIPYQDQHRQQVIALVLHIQQNEFNVPVTLEGQPDLNDIPNVCQVKNGNFWVVLNSDNEVVGTICLLDSGDGVGTLRKMFVRADYRGKIYNTATLLLETLWQWAVDKSFKTVYLGTIERLLAARRFYERNGFELVDKQSLPPQFPVMAVDTHFYKKDI
jgi:putative acetyltransferase